MRFNDRFGADEMILPVPEPYILEDVAVVPGVDGRKMSKSYDNTIGIFDEGKALKKKVMSIVTDSTPLEEPKDPDTCNVFALIRLFADDAKREEVAAAYRAGGFGYGHAKRRCLASSPSISQRLVSVVMPWLRILPTSRMCSARVAEKDVNRQKYGWRACASPSD